MTTLTAPVDTAALAARARAGDEQAFGQLWRVLRPRIQGYLRRRVPDAAEDLCQETFLRAWKGIRSYRPGRGSIDTWIYTVAGNTATDHLRRLACRPRATADVTDHPMADPTDVAEQTTRRLDHRSVLADALADLPERQREAVALRYLQDLSVAEVAARMGCTESAVKSLCNRALTLLRELIVPFVAAVAPEPAEVEIPAEPVAIEPIAETADDATSSSPTPSHPARSSHAVTPTRPRRPGGARRRSDRRRHPTGHRLAHQSPLGRPDRPGYALGLDTEGIRRHPLHAVVARCGRHAAAAETMGPLAAARRATTGRSDSGQPGVVMVNLAASDWRTWTVALAILTALAAAVWFLLRELRRPLDRWEAEDRAALEKYRVPAAAAEPEPVDAPTTVLPAIGEETTVRILPTVVPTVIARAPVPPPWPLPVPQDVVDHIQLWYDDEYRGKHLAGGAR